MATRTRAVSHRQTQPKPADATGRAPGGVPRANPGIPILLDPPRAPRHHLYPLDWIGLLPLVLAADKKPRTMS